MMLREKDDFGGCWWGAGIGMVGSGYFLSLVASGILAYQRASGLHWICGSTKVFELGRGIA